ncbi:ABC-F family ATP-binding cassette domain-containing protein [Erythrobacter sp. AP23]|uniref:ABC-F family ATP-binding cassette domain-containing protein n=1 Tax=Erythrobacter sp. AP23 TaxID=499656 RepID=UPI00076D9EFB|nr:ATP-binding cassette domain-containing protein [Erythrobacter sp. AP23]KWV93793.1 ABC transporter [Erythrobacter sp. AP23]
MSAYVALTDIAAQTPDGRLLFENLSLSIAKESVGLVGRNGSGKSTLLRMVGGLASPPAGTIKRSGTIAFLEQEMPERWPVKKALGIEKAVNILQRIENGTGSADDLELAEWSLEPRVEAALAACGLPSIGLDVRLESLSGGERARIAIARVLLEEPDLLLLDEPTNNLDAAGREAISGLLRNWRGGALIASHDRKLLERMDRIVELSPVGVRSFGGGWTAFEQARNQERDRLVQEAARADAVVRQAHQNAQARKEAKAKRDKAGRAFAAKGSEPKILLDKRAERAENSGGREKSLNERTLADAVEAQKAARARLEVRAPLTIELPPSGLPSGAKLLELDGVVAQVGDRHLGPWTLRIDGPERVAVAGGNGSGKTTLLRIAAGLMQPSMGRAYRAEGRIAMVDQHVSLLDVDKSVLDNVRAKHKGISREAAHSTCARFAFRNREAMRIVGTLSGGERLRAGLAAALSGPEIPWLIILDEPTNHLDIESLEMLEEALRSYDGALLLVSHDQSFLERVGIARSFNV